ncbi:MFS transporter [Sphingobium aromaticivastans]|uniref:MFS transporter n=1 Tax=Sphingobium aromaticivastans TaxID=1778665 RepID=UPI003017BAAC
MSRPLRWRHPFGGNDTPLMEPAGTAQGGGAEAENQARAYGRRMTLIGFASFNVGTGLCYGTFGALVLHLEELFDADRAAMGMALSLVALLHGLTAPIIGMLIPRTGVRPLMISGAVLASLGFALLPFAGDSLKMLSIYGLLIGPGTALMGPLPVLTLVSNWYARGQGRMIGFAMMPVVVTISPMATVWLLTLLGVQGVLLAAAVAVAAVIPFQLLIVERPVQVHLRSVGAEQERNAGVPHPTPARTLNFHQLWRNPHFIMMATAAGVVAGAGVAKSAHLVPILIEQGWALDHAALLLAISGATGVLGSLLFGMIADRWSGATALATGAFVQTVVWLILILPTSFPLLIADAVIIGMCGGGLMSAKAVLVSRLFGRENFPFVAGISSLTAVPFLFLLSPLAGFLRQQSGDYDLPLLVIIGLLALAGLMNLALVRVETRARAADIRRPAVSAA